MQPTARRNRTTRQGINSCNIIKDEIIPVKVYAGCDCQHHTAGDNCEMCEPLYNNVEYMRGTIDNASVCESM